MNIQSAIAHAREVASKKYAEGMLCHANPDDGELDGCIKCAKEHEQLAEWLTELQQYHKTGMSAGEVIKMQCGYAIKMTELEEYETIGTPEECREAMEKQQAKKPTYDGDGYAPDGSFIWDEWCCPRCGSRFEVDYDNYYYCPDCGQKLDWSEEENDGEINKN